LLDEMCSSGLLEKSAGRSPKLTLTAKGRETWAREAPEGRRREVQLREQQRQRQSLLDFLSLVEQKQGKPLGKTELPRFPAPLRQRACDDGLVEAGDKKDSYRLLPAGETNLLAGRPIGEQLERLRRLCSEIVGRWGAAQERLRQDLDAAGGRAL